jgi:hypothetical protein
MLGFRENPIYLEIYGMNVFTRRFEEAGCFDD